MRHFYRVGLLFVSLSMTAPQAMSQPTPSPVPTQLVTKLDRYEPFHEAMVFHDGVLWVGRSRKEFASVYNLEMYGPQGELLAEARFSHALRYIYPYERHSIIVVGVAASPEVASYYTIVTREGDRFRVETVAIPPSQATADRWLGHQGTTQFFTDPAGQQAGAPIGAPAPTVFSFDGTGTPRYVGPMVQGPTDGALLDSGLFLIESSNHGMGLYQLVRLDWTDGVRTDMLAAPHSKLHHVLPLPTGQLAMASSHEQAVLVFDSKTHRETKIDLDWPSPRALTVYGRCLAVGAEMARVIVFLDMTSPSHDIVAAWDLSPAGEDFLRLQSLAANTEHGQVYARSSVPCIPGLACAPERNAVIMAEDPTGVTAKRCGI